MSDAKKTRMSMLDSLSGSPAPLAMQSSSRPMRAARDAVDAHKVWELDPDSIEDTRIADRLNQNDVDDLRASIETSGQTVPILVRRHPSESDKYLLVYGRRRLEAIRSSNEVEKVKALIASFDDEFALQAQISENIGRRDLSYIEKALFAKKLNDGGFGTQSKVAEVLGVTKSWMSMALSIVEKVSVDLIRTIGPAPSIGRPRWETLANAVEQCSMTQEALIEWVKKTRKDAKPSGTKDVRPVNELSDKLFEGLMTLLSNKPTSTSETTQRKPLFIDGQKAATLTRFGKKVQLDIEPGKFADFIESKAEYLLEQMHRYWREDQEELNQSSNQEGGTTQAE